MTKTTTDRIDTKLIDELLKDYQKPEDILGENGLLKQFTKALLERAMQVYNRGRPMLFVTIAPEEGLKHCALFPAQLRGASRRATY